MVLSLYPRNKASRYKELGIREYKSEQAKQIFVDMSIDSYKYENAHLGVYFR
jgi:hypothetical protein